MTVAIAAAAAVLAYLVLRARNGRRTAFRGGELASSASFVAGAVAIAWVLGPAYDALADRSFAWHMGQHLVLSLVAPPLLLLGHPLRTLLAGVPRRTGRSIARLLRSRPVAVVTHPVTTWVLFVATLWAAHFSGLYELALENEAVHDAEHGLFLGTALLFWAVALGEVPWPDPLPYPARALFLFLAMPFSAFLGLALYSAQHVLYPHYARAGRAALADQQAGGELMWILGGIAMFVAFMLTIAAWARDEARAGREAADVA